ncbi:MAG TPA: hypothetical protein VF746_09865 [Longimicrobium sp.]|jgi:hypothetical protein
MEKKLRLDLEKLAVESHDTSPAATAPADPGVAPDAATRITSCTPPPYCTC